MNAAEQNAVLRWLRQHNRGPLAVSRPSASHVSDVSSARAPHHNVGARAQIARMAAVLSEARAPTPLLKRHARIARMESVMRASAASRRRK